MPTDSEEINLIKRLCILNFLELQDIRRRLNISTTDTEGLGTQGYYDYANAVRGYLKEMDHKMCNLIRDYPHLEGDDSGAVEI